MIDVSPSESMRPPTRTLRHIVAILLTLAGCSADDPAGPAGPPPETGVPRAPSDLTATPACASVLLTWSDNSSIEDGYQIFRSTAPDTVILLVTLPPGTTTYVDPTVTLAKTYGYRLCAYNEVGYSSSCPTSAVATPTSPVPPLDLAVALTEPSQALLSWVDASTNEIGFVVWSRSHRHDTPPGTWTSWAIEREVNANVVYAYATVDLTVRCYEYRVQATGLCGPSILTDTAALGCP